MRGVCGPGRRGLRGRVFRGGRVRGQVRQKLLPARGGTGCGVGARWGAGGEEGPVDTQGGIYGVGAQLSDCASLQDGHQIGINRQDQSVQQVGYIWGLARHGEEQC